MGKQTWVCVPCRKSYLRKQSLTSVDCPACQGPCKSIHEHVRIPSPKETREWDEFWARIRSREKTAVAFQAAVRQVTQESPRAARRTRQLATAAKRVSYVESISRPLTRALEYSAALPAHQLAGHAANVDFWIGEAKHCLTIIDGYRERFDRLRAAQADYSRKHGVVAAALRRGTQDHTRQDLRRDVCESIERFLTRCRGANLLSETQLKSALHALGM